MKALSVRQPWASLIASGYKRFEIRTWPTRHRGPLLICAATGSSEMTATALRRPDVILALRRVWKSPVYQENFAITSKTLARGVAVAVVDVVNCIPGSAIPAKDRRELPWLYRDIDDEFFAWELANPRPLNRVVPVSGRLGLFEVNLD